jgi:dihydroorotase
VAVSDDGHPVSSANVMRRALQYASTFGLPVIDHCEDLTLSRHAAAHEGPISAWTGIRAQPASAEVVMLARDLTLCAETGARYHAAHVSCEGSVDLLRRAKQRGLPVTAEVTVQHLSLNDEATRTYDPNVKCNRRSGARATGPRAWPASWTAPWTPWSRITRPTPPWTRPSSTRRRPSASSGSRRRSR